MIVGPGDKTVVVWKCLVSVLVPVFKNKHGLQSCGNYRGIKLRSHTMKIWGTVVEARLRDEVMIYEQQYGTLCLCGCRENL